MHKCLSFFLFFFTLADVYTVIDVAYSPNVLQAAEKDQVKKNELIQMAMKCIEEKLQFTLSHVYHITKFKIKGSIQRMKQNLMGIQTGSTDLKEKMRKGKLMNVNGKLYGFKIFVSCMHFAN